MDFTREPIIETVITPKEGCKLVVRSSKTNGQEEHFVDAVEVVSFGNSLFFRSLERPKTFLVPVSDYEILEVREARMVLKNVGIDRTIKIAGGREAQMRGQREQPIEKVEEEVVEQPAIAEKPSEGRIDKKRDRRRNYRRRRGREVVADEEAHEANITPGKIELAEPRKPTGAEGETSPLAQQVLTTSILTSLLPPPPTLISETIAHYKDKFKDAFYSREESEGLEEATSKIALNQPEYGSFELSEEEEEEIYQQRKQQLQKSDNHREKEEEEEENNREEQSSSEDLPIPPATP